MYKEEINKILRERETELIFICWKTSNEKEFYVNWDISYLSSTEYFLIHRVRKLSIPWDWIIGYGKE